MSLVLRAQEFATNAHAGQVRKHGQRPYIYHPACVARYLEEKNFIGDIIAAAWLHDTLEDCPAVTYNILETEFGPTVAGLVRDVTHPVIMGKTQRSERWEIYLRHYENASHLGKVLKLADRACNLQEYVDYWNDVDTKGKDFLRNVYLDESNDLVESLKGTDAEIEVDLICLINELDELCSEE